MVQVTPSRNISDQAQLGDNVVGTEEIIDGDVRSADIGDDQVDSEHYAAGSIDEEHVADDAISLAKMAAGIDGQMITYDASGNPVAFGPGTAGQLVTSNGAGAAPSFQDAPAAAQSLAIPLEKSTGGFDDRQDNIPLIDAPDAQATDGFASFVVPTTATIDSIEFYFIALNTGGNFVFDYSFISQDGNTQETDSALDQVVADGTPNQTIQKATIPSTAYDGLTKGRVWNVKVTRDGANASDTVNSAAQFGLLVVHLS